MPIDPTDGLPLAEVGEWAEEKHTRLRKYVDITRGARRKYTDASRPVQFRGGATYIDLFCGPGRCLIRDTTKIIDGSSIVAIKAALDGGVPFSEVHVADIDSSFSEATVARLGTIGTEAIGYIGPAELTVQQIVSRLNPHGLHFAFLDPFNLGGLAFSIIRELSKVQRMDLLLHVSVQDLQRNLGRYIGPEKSPLDDFAPGWRENVDANQALNAFRVSLLAYWQSLVRELGFMHQRDAELVTGSNSQRLYWLIFLSRHSIANELWDKIRVVSGQRSLDL